MAKEFYETAGTTPVYNQGVLRTPGFTDWDKENIGAPQNLFADLLEKDIVGGQVAEGFVGDVGTLLANDAGKPGHYIKAVEVDYTDVVGVLLLATDAYDGPRFINVVKGGTLNAKAGALRALDATKAAAVAAALGGKYDDVQKTIKF